MSWPSTLAVPLSGGKKQLSIFIVVDLPAPFGPRKPSTSPLATANETPSTATIGPKALRSPFASIISRVPVLFSRQRVTSAVLIGKLRAQSVLRRATLWNHTRNCPGSAT